MKEILREIGMIYRCFESMANLEFKDYNLNKNQYTYLVRINEHPGIILQEICDMIKVDRSTASRAVKKIESMGYIHKVDTHGTGKKVELHPTEKGKALYQVLLAEEEHSIALATSNLNEVEQETLYQLLKKVRYNVEPEWEAVKRGVKRPFHSPEE